MTPSDPSTTTPDRDEAQRQRWELLAHIDALFEGPLIALSFVWLGLLILDFTTGLTPLLQTVSNVIWVVFIIDFGIAFVIAPHKWRYLRYHWPTVLALLLPALRVLRLARGLRLLRAARAVRSINLIRLLTSLNRGMRALTQAMGRRGVGYAVALTIIVTFGGAAGMALFEGPAALREAGIGDANGLDNYGEALWWTGMIMTTLGSEYWPRTIEGRILGWLLSVYALAVFGYITATVASFFIDRDRQTAERVDATDIARLRAEIIALRRQLGDVAAPQESKAAQRGNDTTDAM